MPSGDQIAYGYMVLLGFGSAILFIGAVSVLLATIVLRMSGRFPIAATVVAVSLICNGIPVVVRAV